MDVEQFKDDVREGRIDANRLVDLVVTLQRQLQAAKRRIDELENKLGGSATQKIAEPFSVRSEERRQEARGKKRRKRNRPLRRGRITTAEKIARAARTEKVFPAGVPHDDCKLSHTRPIWRLEDGRAVLDYTYRRATERHDRLRPQVSPRVAPFASAEFVTEKRGSAVRWCTPTRYTSFLDDPPVGGIYCKIPRICSV